MALMYAAAGVAVLYALAVFATSRRLPEALAGAYPTVTSADLDGAVDEFRIRTAQTTAVAVCLWVWMAVKNGAGRRWARVVATGLGVIKLLDVALCFAVAADSPPEDAADRALAGYSTRYLVFAGVTGALALTVLVHLYWPASSRYYADSRRWKAALRLRGDRDRNRLAAWRPSPGTDDEGDGRGAGI